MIGEIKNPKVRKLIIDFACLGHTGIILDGKLYIDGEKTEDIFEALIAMIPDTDGGEGDAAGA